MEQSLYEEQIPFVVKPQPAVMNHMKKNLTLDLGHTTPMSKKMKFGPGIAGAPVLSTPDLNMLNMDTPEMEKIILASGIGVTPTPTQQILFSNGVTEEQEIYAKGFEDALKNLHNSKQVELPASSSGSSTSGAVYTNLDHKQTFSGFPMDDVVIKDEPQTVPSTTPPMSPIDMECQERIKLERKRQRNRVAASKCRRRKLERISRLEDKVKLLKGENTELSSMVNKLKENVCQLKEQVMEHIQAGCQIAITPQY